MNEIIFDIKIFSYVINEEPDVSFIPMLQRRKLNKFGRAGIYTLNNAYSEDVSNLVFSSNFGDVERIKHLIAQRQIEGEVSPAGFSSSVHNATIGQFSLLKGINASYNSISAGEKSLSAGFLESVLSGNSLFCYTECLDVLKSVSVNTCKSETGKYMICENLQSQPAHDEFEDFIKFLNGDNEIFASDLYLIKRIL